MNMLAILAIIWPISLFFYKLWMYLTYTSIELSSISFKVKRAFSSDMNVLVRIVSKERYGGGNVPNEVMEELYMKYGPISWRYDGNRFCSLLTGFCSSLTGFCSFWIGFCSFWIGLRLYLLRMINRRLLWSNKWYDAPEKYKTK